MPVQLKSQIDPLNPMVITKDEYEIGRKNFIEHYYLEGCDCKFGGQDLEIPWQQLEEAVSSYSKENEIQDVALRMVYCYNPVDEEMNLRIQLCEMQESAQIANTYNLIDDVCEWYKIEESELVACQDHNLYSNTYFNNFYYCANPPCDGANAQLLADGAAQQLYARTITFPWDMEVMQMYKDNGYPDDAKLCFGATSYVHGNSGDSNIAYPHGLVLYLKDADGYPMLNNDRDSVAIFHNKGADYATLCPKYCGIYVVPTPLPQQQAQQQN